MKKEIYILIGILMFNFCSTVYAQDKTFEEKAKILKIKIENVTAKERSLLKEAIKNINKRLNSHEITAIEAQKLKESAALKSAKNIQDKVTLIENELRNLIKNKVDKTIYKEENGKRFSIGGFDIDYTKYHRRHHHKDYWKRRTHNYTVLSVGLSNLAIDDDLGSLENNDIDFWESHYFEIGSNSKTRIFKNSSFLYVDYGFSLIYNILSPNQNKYFEVNGNVTDIKVYSEILDKSKFKNVQLIFPAYLEMSFSQPYQNHGTKRFRLNRGFKIGLGGFLGLNLKSKQILKYKVNNVKIKDFKKGDFNVNNFLYGLNAFVGVNDTSIFVRYHLNSVFKNNLLNQNNVAFGLRFDW